MGIVTFTSRGRQSAGPCGRIRIPSVLHKEDIENHAALIYGTP